MAVRSKLKYRMFSDKMGGRSLLPILPRNRRPFVQSVIDTFVRDGILYSPTGVTANLVCMWLREQNFPFTLSWDIKLGVFIVKSPSHIKGGS